MQRWLAATSNKQSESSASRASAAQEQQVKDSQGGKQISGGTLRQSAHQLDPAAQNIVYLCCLFSRLLTPSSNAGHKFAAPRTDGRRCMRFARDVTTIL